MRKNYRKAQSAPRLTYKSNEQITAEKVRLLGYDGEHIGVMPLADAIARAKEAELDLIEINPGGDPPVCKIEDFGRLKYAEEKELRKQKARQKKVEVKGIRLSVRIGKHDMEVRIKQAQKFLEQNDKVKIEVVMRGRERHHSDLAREVLANFITILEEQGLAILTETPPAQQGGRLTTIISAKK